MISIVFLLMKISSIDHTEVADFNENAAKAQGGFAAGLLSAAGAGNAAALGSLKAAGEEQDGQLKNWEAYTNGQVLTQIRLPFETLLALDIRSFFLKFMNFETFQVRTSKVGIA